MIDLGEFDPTGSPIDEKHGGREYRAVQPPRCEFSGFMPCAEVSWFVVEPAGDGSPAQEFMWVCEAHKYRAFS